MYWKERANALTDTQNTLNKNDSCTKALLELTSLSFGLLTALKAITNTSSAIYSSASHKRRGIRSSKTPIKVNESCACIRGKWSFGLASGSQAQPQRERICPINSALGQVLFWSIRLKFLRRGKLIVLCSHSYS